MKPVQKSLVAIALMLVFALCGCPDNSESGQSEHTHGPEQALEHGHIHEGSERGEHDRDGHEHHGAEGEESGTELGLDETYNTTRNGAQLYLAYDRPSNAFKGWVKNATSETLEQVRVEVHLSNGKEIGPTMPTDLVPGQKLDIELAAESTDFNGWTAHPEVGHGEHGHEHGEGEHGHEHGEHGAHL